LHPPEPLRREGDCLLAPARSQRWRILGFEGPERICGEWWLEEFARDYFRVHTREGEQLWIYRVPGPSGQIFLHGIYD
jgi:protein ImuB